MTMTDPIADMLTRVRNASSVQHDTVDIPASNIKKEIARILLEEGYIKGYDVIEDGKQGLIRMQLKYGKNGTDFDNFNGVFRLFGIGDGFFQA